VIVPAVPVWEVVLRTIVVYLAVFGLLRLAGKRELGQMSVLDLVVILVIANAVQNAMNGGDNSLTDGLVAAGTLVAMNVVMTRFARRIPFFSRLVVQQPTLLVQDGKVIQAHLDRENVAIEEVEMAAREHGLADLSDVSAAILEQDGSISVIPRQGGEIHRHDRRIRQLRHRP
jgi:uncharacterized membrane protein YcaP (DUF421 family)